MNLIRLSTLFAVLLAPIGLLPAKASAQWMQINGCATWMTQGQDDGVGYAIDCSSASDKGIWKYTGNGSFPWTALPGAGVQISRWDANSMWLRTANGQIKKWNNTTSTWGSALAFGGGTACATSIVARSSGALWALGCESTPNKSIWTWNGSSWSSISGSAAQISTLTSNSGTLLAVDANNGSWSWNGSSWTAFPGQTNSIATGMSFDFEVLGIGDHYIYRWQGQWVPFVGPTPHSATKLFTGAQNFIWALNQAGEIFRVAVQ